MMIGIIYKLKCNTTQEFYIGSTFNLNKRISQHKEYKNHCKSINIIKRNNYQFIILQNIETDNKKSLELYENLYIIIGWKTGRCVNFKLATSTKKLTNHRDFIYRLKNKDKKNKQQNEWYYNNKDKYKNEYRVKYREKKNEKARQRVNCPICNLEMNKGSLNRHHKRKHNYA